MMADKTVADLLASSFVLWKILLLPKKIMSRILH